MTLKQLPEYLKFKQGLVTQVTVIKESKRQLEKQIPLNQNIGSMFAVIGQSL